MLITDMENLSQFYQLRHLIEPCIVKYMACSLQTQQVSIVSVVKEVAQQKRCVEENGPVKGATMDNFNFLIK